MSCDPFFKAFSVPEVLGLEEPEAPRTKKVARDFGRKSENLNCWKSLAHLICSAGKRMTTLSLDHALRRELRDLDPFDREWFELMATATAKALSEGRASTITSNIPEVFDCCRRLAAHLGASIERIDRTDGRTDLIVRPPPCRRAR
jgi:hypothetical protein